MQRQDIQIRPFDRASDIPALLRLIQAVEDVDQTGQDSSEESLRAEFEWMGHDPQSDRWVAAETGKEDCLLGHSWTFSQTPARSILHIAVLPAARRQGIGSALLCTALDRIASKGARQAVSVAEVDNLAASAFLRNRGFEVAGYNRFFTADAAADLPAPRWPGGYKALPLSQFRDLAYFVEAANACYSTMWGHAQNTKPSTVEGYQQSMANYPEYFNPDGMFVVFDERDSVCGLCLGNLEQGGQERHQAKIIDSPAILPERQPEELLRPLVLTCMHWLNTLSDGEFRLETWGDSESAVSVYSDLGFTLLPHGLEAEFLLELA
jgi:ribosomal protein S18 acetylase RimI-like enzyme